MTGLPVKAWLFWAAAVLLLQPASAKAESPLLIYFPMTSDQSVAEHLPMVNAEIEIVLGETRDYRTQSQEHLSEFLIMDPIENLAFCNRDPGCIADMASEAKARLILLGHLKKSFDGSRILVEFQLIDVPGRKLHKEKFGQLSKDSNLPLEMGRILRSLLGIARKKAPPPKPVLPPPPQPQVVDKPPSQKKDKPTQVPAVAGAGEGNKAWSNPVTWSVAGLGLASIAVATALGVMSEGEVSDAENKALWGDPLAAEKRYQKAEDLSLGANIAFGIGGAALVTAVVLLVVDLNGAPAQSAPKVACGPAGCTASLSIGF